MGVVSGSRDKTLRLWDLESGQTLRTLQGGLRVVSGSRDKTLRLWDLDSGQTLRTLHQADDVSLVEVTPDGRLAVSATVSYTVSATFYDTTLRVWDLESGQTLRWLQGHTDRVSAVAITPDGRRVVSASHDDTLRLWDLESGKEIAAFTGNG